MSLQKAQLFAGSTVLCAEFPSRSEFSTPADMLSEVDLLRLRSAIMQYSRLAKRDR